ncbi:DUF960 family protein [Staphylococcus sp. NRL 16/872]|uniref:DUF960 family protein n=1 Tax=Staphylococcus sp. NRL 16/872 TaxID=2930131 RepID=UPI001FB45F24|nr:MULTISPECIES: DUF960 family protein [unclassified Staphylococcus]MCJ1657242.1 DUF960 domain-containing protein [Staphylococcus sp. NRL 21/187]WEN69330.1 DUF960 family protein [Staphylococcus sp. NRL 16/872]
MEINRYITRGINDMIPLEIQIMMWEMVRLRDKNYEDKRDYFHIFRLSQDQTALTIVHEQEQPLYKLEYHYTNYEKNQNALPKKVYVIREDDVDTFYYVMLLPEEY